jgi:PAS domain-containing protein
MESILEELNEGVIIVDEQLRMIFANEALIRLGRYEPGDIQGHTPDATIAAQTSHNTRPIRGHRLRRKIPWMSTASRMPSMPP